MKRSNVTPNTVEAGMGYKGIGRKRVKGKRRVPNPLRITVYEL